MNFNKLVLLFLFIYIFLVQGTLSHSGQLSSDGRIRYNLDENIEINENTPIHHNSEINLNINKNGRGRLTLYVFLSRFETHQESHERQIIVNTTFEREFTNDFILDHSGFLELIIIYDSIMNGFENSTQEANFSYKMEWRRVITLKLFSPIFWGIGLLLGAQTLNQSLSYIGMSQSINKRLQMSLLYLKFNYYSKTFISNKVSYGFIIFSIVFNDPSKFPTSIKVNNRFFDNITSDSIYISIYWFYYLLIASKVFSSEFSEVAYEWTYPVGRGEIYRLKLVHIMKEIIFTNCIISIFWYLLEMKIFLEVQGTLIKTYIFINLILFIFTASILLLYPIVGLLKISTPSRVGVLYLSVLVVEMNSFKHKLIPSLFNIAGNNDVKYLLIEYIILIISFSIVSTYCFISMEIDKK